MKDLIECMGGAMAGGKFRGAVAETLGRCDDHLSQRAASVMICAAIGVGAPSLREFTA
jgi:hypothetical protein